LSIKDPERVMRGRLGAYVTHGTHDSREITAAARAAFRDRFERDADPEGVLPLAERQRRAEHLRKAYYTRLSRLSAIARRKSTNGKDATSSDEQTQHGPEVS
jgi:hypothetical protein